MDQRQVYSANEEAQLIVGAELTRTCGVFAGIDIELVDAGKVPHRLTVPHGGVVCDSDVSSQCARGLGEADIEALDAVLALDGDVPCAYN